MKKLFYVLALLLSNYLPVKAQQPFRPDQPVYRINNLKPAQPSPQSGPLVCGTADLTPAQTLSLTQQANLALQRKRALRVASAAITYVPIRPHIVRRSDGTGGFSLARMNQAMAIANSHFLLNGSGIQFYFAGITPDYIDDNNLFTTFPYPEGTSVDGKDAYNALNQYYVNFIPGYGGYAPYPTNNITSTRSFIATNLLDPKTVSHELGHNFNLIHTHGSPPTNELVTRGAGANCMGTSSASVTVIVGDLLCDTPADPYGMPGAGVIYPDGCPQYDPNSTARDAHGDAYSPSMTNIMSYYPSCTHDFTPGQYERMQAGLALRQTHTAYTLDAPATNVVAASNLTATSNGVAVVLTWQDNANNEMGYFIERSTSPTTDFVSIGGTAPNETRFVDSKITPQTQYYYRIRPSNTTTGSLSSIAPILTLPRPPITGLITTSITQTSARLTWNSLGEGAQYQMQWRPVGAANWPSNYTFTNSFYDLNNLSMNTAYEWRVRAVGSETYSGPVSFTTGVGCRLQIPGYLSASPLVTSAVLRWEPIPAGTNTSFNVRYRATGTSDWTNISNVTSASANITGLTGGTTYEWQVRTVCNNGGATSGFLYLHTFSTSPCIPPSNLQATNITTSSARLVWNYGLANAETSYQVRYRIVGTTNWTVLNNQPTSTTGSSLTLTGLSSNTTYEWQVRTLCSATETSDFVSSSVNFQTLPIEPDLTPILYVRPSPTYGNTTISVVLDLIELNSRPTSGSVTVKITKDARMGLTFDTGLKNLGGWSVQNSVWSFVSSDANYYVLTTTQPIAAGDKLSFGLSGTLSPGATTGTLTISATVLGSNTVDSKPTNNIDADKIDSFQQ